MLFKRNTNHKLFNQWIKRYHGVLYQHALWMTGNQDVAADMVQETFYQAWLAIGKLKDNQKALPWLLTILRRATYREYRCQYQHRHTVEQLQHLQTQQIGGEEYHLLDIYHYLGTLSHTQREAFLLHTLHGFSYTQVSEQLDIPIGTVMSRISRAKAALKALCGDEATQDNVIKFTQRNKS